MRALLEVETIGRRKAIVVTELPYLVGPERVKARIKELVKDNKLNDVADVKNLTDRQPRPPAADRGQNGFVPEALLEQLYRQTPLEETFGINNVVLVNGVPPTLGLKEMLEVFLGHRFEVVRRRRCSAGPRPPTGSTSWTACSSRSSTSTRSSR